MKIILRCRPISYKPSVTNVDKIYPLTKAIRLLLFNALLLYRTPTCLEHDLMFFS